MLVMICFSTRGPSVSSLRDSAGSRTLPASFRAGFAHDTATQLET